MEKKISEILLEAQSACFKAHTDQILDIVRSYDNYDEAIKLLIDERRRVFKEFSQRIDAAEETEK